MTNHDYSLITGSSGFIGLHLFDYLVSQQGLGQSVVGFDRLPSSKPYSDQSQLGHIDSLCDIRKLPDGHFRHVYHLAAEAEVVMPYARMREVLQSNITGTLNLLEVLNPDIFILASSSAVYGHKDTQSLTVADQKGVSPLGEYGMSKAMSEIICQKWASSMQKVALAFRFGNVIGPGGRGFIPFLVKHALKYPEGQREAQCRGGGIIVRDYLPVHYLIEVLTRSTQLNWSPGYYNVFNLGTGRGMTNGAVASIVQNVLSTYGLHLSISWDNPLESGESSAIVLDNMATEKVFDLPAPDAEEVVQSIEDTTRYYVDAMQTT